MSLTPLKSNLNSGDGKFREIKMCDTVVRQKVRIKCNLKFITCIFL